MHTIQGERDIAAVKFPPADEEEEEEEERTNFFFGLRRSTMRPKAALLAHSLSLPAAAAAACTYPIGPWWGWMTYPFVNPAPLCT